MSKMHQTQHRPYSWQQPEIRAMVKKTKWAERFDIRFSAETAGGFQQCGVWTSVRTHRARRANLARCAAWPSALSWLWWRLRWTAWTG